MYLSLLTAGGSETARASFLADWVVPGATRAVVQERLRVESHDVPVGEGYNVYVDVLVEFGKVGRVATWLIGLRRDAAVQGNRWRIASLTVLTTVRGLYRLELASDKQFAVENLKLSAEDFQVRLPQGMAFVAETELGVTGIVLLGKGDLTFSPTSKAEKGQVKIFSGAETFQTRFDTLYVRLNPQTFKDHISAAALRPRPVDQRDFRRADQVFQENRDLSFGLDLADLSREKWSVVPQVGDFITEIHSGKTHLAYVRLKSDPEDIRFLDRTRDRTVSLYASKENLATHGPFFSEDDRIDYDILHYDIEASFEPKREWIDGTASVFLVAKREPISAVMMSLAESLVLRSVTSRKFGHLMALRVTGQNSVLINLPEPLEPNTILELEFSYGGRLHAGPPDREALAPAQEEEDLSVFFTIPPEPSFIYTGRSYWYPQGQLTDYATASLELRVPEDYATVATGALDEGFPKLVTGADSRVWKEYHFSATQPVRYLAWATTKFVHVDAATVSIPPPDPEKGSHLSGVSYYDINVSVESTNLLRRRALELSADTQDVLKFYGTLIGDVPYQAFTLAVVERNTPGGHSPAYFAALSQPTNLAPITWRADPAYFNDFPEFFVAHEVAHQWWGQCVGWKNYHEQWLSEGLAQYFAALYSERVHRKEVFDRVIRQMARWTLAESDQGPVYLGFRLGHLKRDSRIFRAVAYNKGGLVLHMLRRLVGDEAFFGAIRRFYTAWRFKKAGTEDLKAAFEAETHRPLDRFFDRWIYNATLPRVKFSYTTEADAVVVRFEQVGEVFDVPITVHLEYANAPAMDITIPLTDQVTEQRIPIKGVLKNVEANRDEAAPVIFARAP